MTTWSISSTSSRVSRIQRNRGFPQNSRKFLPLTRSLLAFMGSRATMRGLLLFMRISMIFDDVQSARDAGTFSERTRRLNWDRNTCRSEEHTSDLQSLMRISYAVFCLKKKTHSHTQTKPSQPQVYTTTMESK